MTPSAQVYVSVYHFIHGDNYSALGCTTSPGGEPYCSGSPIEPNQVDIEWRKFLLGQRINEVVPLLVALSVEAPDATRLIDLVVLFLHPLDDVKGDVIIFGSDILDTDEPSGRVIGLTLGFLWLKGF